MKQRNIFTPNRLSMAVMLAIAPAALQVAHAGAGWGDSADIVGSPIKTPTYYANSPSGVQDPTACFTAPPSTGPFLGADTANPSYIQPSVGVGCDTGTALRKFVDGMSGIPVAVADTTTYPGSDYYEIAVVEYTQKMHSDLANPTRLRGYVQISANGTVPLNYLNADGTQGAAILLPNGSPAMAVAKPSYLGPIINSTSGTPARVKFYNLLPAGAAGNLHLPVDETMTGAGTGPDGVAKYQQNRVEIHLHGGDNPWISDGTPHQWILPAADETALKAAGHADMARGVGAKNVPDMPDPGPGAMTYYFPNGQSGRMMFYHDHTVGLTRLNVYAGVVAGYMVNDAAGVGENHASLAGLLPPAADTIPLIIQDKTFVPKDVAVQDAKWKGLGRESDLWYPHVYETNQDPNSVDGTNPVGRWDWGNWFWPVFPSVYDLPTGEIGAINGVTNLSEASTTPEAFMDTPVVNGTAYPTMTVEPKAYRFRVLNGANDRFLNLGLYLAADKNTTDPVTPTNSAATKLCDGVSGVAVADCTEVKMVNFDASYVPVPAGTLSPNGVSGFPTVGGITGTGWGAQVGGLFPQGAPDPATAGPDIVQIGNEGGLLANPLVIPSTPLNYEYNKRSVTVLNVLERGLYLGNAERADVLIDFSKYAGKTLILYNDAPAPVPASDPRIDYFTGNGDNTGVGGAPSTKPGFGPNTRTIMQIVVAPAVVNAGVATVDVAGLQANLPKAYASIQAKPVVPEPEFNAAFPGISPTARNNARIYTGSVYLNKYNAMSFTAPEDINFFPAPTCSTVAACNTALAAQKATPTATAPATVVAGGKGLVHAPAGSAVSAYVESKAIQELFDPTYGRMNATLGVELPFTSAITQTTIPLGYVDPATETVADGETQFWKITHNGVDTHPVHFHLVNVQVINRIGWDGTIKAPYGDEIGWKETVKMNPLEDIVVAVRAKKPTLTGVAATATTPAANGFGLPLSQRLMDPSQPAGSALGFTQVDPTTGNPAVVTNQMANYGWEYVWHCHILGHEENDFMRPVVFNANELAPAAPTGLSLGLDAAGHYQLSWADAATTEYAYKVEHATVTPAGTSAYTDLTATVTPAAQVVGAAPLANATSFIDMSFIAPGPNAVATPAVTATPTSTTVALSWAADANAASFTIERAAGLNAVSGFTSVGTSTTPSFTDSTVVASTDYTYRVIASAANSDVYRVTAVGANGNGSASVTAPGGIATSTAVNATTTAVVAPAVILNAPTNVFAQLMTNTTVQLTWVDTSTGETGYVIESSRNGGAWTAVNAAANAQTATVTLPRQTGTYQFRVTAMNAAVAGPVSAVVTVNLNVAPATAAAPSATSTIARQAVVTWVDALNNNATYALRYRLNGGIWITASTTINGNATSYTVNGLITGGSYQFQIRGANNQGNANNWSTASTAVVIK